MEDFSVSTKKGLTSFDVSPYIAERTGFSKRQLAYRLYKGIFGCNSLFANSMRFNRVFLFDDSQE
ncbi:hypothetical protein Pla110_42400 [Polystyrenella longa]|uniref:Uncharacterized protein n=1 Tax=Polystyrenella longa TaxID=2528007 RepID=A0A518CTB9_9PLAN|nr:hypothetical protein Pla110_42400 [Polystyrenella longa]